MDVGVYSTPTCPYCKMVKEYLSSKSINFLEHDVSEDKAALDEMVKVSGQMGVPVITVGEEVVIGFDKAKIDTLLNV